MKEKVAIITGATSMISRACAQVFAEEGMKLMLVGRSKTKLEELANELKCPVEIHVMDVTSEMDVKKMIRKTISTFKKIDALIQNVAIYPWKRIEELTLEEWQETLNINLSSAFLTTQAAFSEMKQYKAGKFVFMSSISGEVIGLPHMSAYAASKAGLNGFMRSAALEFSKYNINVNSISPGKIYDEQTLSKEECEKKLRSIPLQRFVKPRDIAEMALFLISEKARNITGQNYIVDGGQTILGEEAHIKPEYL
jgi:3-oxoacyl-[acyl-carrier protein] reductase